MNFFKIFFGEKWKFRVSLYLVIYIILLFWPAVVFFKRISFQPAVFTQEWIKSVCSISIIFLILEYQKFIFELHRKRSYSKEILLRKIILPYKMLLNKLHTLKKETQSDLDEIILEWVKIYKDAGTIDMYGFNVDFKNKKLYDFRRTYELDYLNNEIERIISHGKQIDISELQRKIQLLLDDFDEEIKKLN